MYFRDKTIWVTGASSGIGKSVAIELSNLSVNLILSARNKEALETVKQACKYPDKVQIVLLDLENHSEIKTRVTEAIQCFGTIDILINNAGISQRSFVNQTNLTVDKRIMDINYLGTIAVTKALLPHFVEKKSGHFVVITSIVGKIGTPLRSSYAASKHALHGFFDSLRAEHYNDNIIVTLVCPGFVTTAISKNALTGNGLPQNKMDAATKNGMYPDVFAKKMLRAVSRKKEEVYIGGLKERTAVYAKRFFPKILSIILRKLAVT